ncbi:hypothetical protein M0R45_008558 [Rubus argutus]|uniref:Uncharacterized protein n=1 Tax=Rubus argutus TaxID=59490 RepID=A0AAW1Y4F5_RUBAR
MPKPTLKFINGSPVRHRVRARPRTPLPGQREEKKAQFRHTLAGVVPSNHRKPSRDAPDLHSTPPNRSHRAAGAGNSRPPAVAYVPLPLYRRTTIDRRRRSLYFEPQTADPLCWCAFGHQHRQNNWKAKENKKLRAGDEKERQELLHLVDRREEECKTKQKKKESCGRRTRC